MNTNMGELKGLYRGGEYIELLLNGEQAQDIINVFDYKSGTPRIENTPTAVEKAVKNWMIEDNQEFIIFDITRIWTSDDDETL